MSDQKHGVFLSGRTKTQQLRFLCLTAGISLIRSVIASLLSFSADTQVLSALLLSAFTLQSCSKHL